MRHIIVETTLEAASDAANNKAHQKGLEAGKLIRQRLPVADERLSNSGFIDTSMLGTQVDCSRLYAHSLESVVTMIEEIYGNILKHVQPKRDIA